MRKNRKGYFFLLDAFIGSAIIFVSLAIILASDVKVNSLRYDYSVAEDYSTFVINTKIEDLNNQYVNGLVSSGVITDTKNTVMKQVSLFYYNAYYVCPVLDSVCRNGNLSYSQNIIQNITHPLFTQKYGFEYIIRDYEKNINYSVYSKNLDKKNSSNFIVVSKKITFFQINTTEMFGPQIVDIIVWV